MDIIEKLLDLQKQATLERSHYYVARCVTEAIQEITELRKKHCPECGHDWSIRTCEKCGHRWE